MASPELAFTQAGDHEFAFDTGEVKGRFRLGGRSTGLVPVSHIKTGVALTMGEGMFNHYRVFTRGLRYGYGARRWPSQATHHADGSVGVFWRATSERPFEMRAHYSWVAPDTIDLVTTVQAVQPLEGFEVFLASYYGSDFVDSRVWAPQSDGKAGFVQATQDQGIWQAFPRDRSSQKVIEDGRWDLEPHPLHWTVKTPYAQPIALRRDPLSGVTIVSISRPESCFGVFTPYGEEKHYSNYFSLFGQDLAVGEAVRNTSRLMVLDNPSHADILGRAREFLR